MRSGCAAQQKRVSPPASEASAKGDGTASRRLRGRESGPSSCSQSPPMRERAHTDEVRSRRLGVGGAVQATARFTWIVSVSPAPGSVAGLVGEATVGRPIPESRGVRSRTETVNGGQHGGGSRALPRQEAESHLTVRVVDVGVNQDHRLPGAELHAAVDHRDGDRRAR